MRTRLTTLVRRVRTWNRARSPWGRARNLATRVHQQTSETLRALANLHHDVRHIADMTLAVRKRVDSMHSRLTGLDDRIEGLELHVVDTGLGDDWVLITAQSPLVDWVRSEPTRAEQFEAWVADPRLVAAPAVAVHRHTLEVQAAKLGAWHGPLAWTWETVPAAVWPFPLAVPTPSADVPASAA